MKKKRIRRQLQFMLQWPLILVVLILIFNILVGFIDSRAGIAMGFGTFMYTIICLCLYIYSKNNIMNELVNFASEYAHVQKKLLAQMGIPYAITDETGRILWMNDAFINISELERHSLKKNISFMFPELTKDLLTAIDCKMQIHDEYNGRKYKIELKENDVSSGDDRVEKMISIYLYDETEVLQYKQEINDQKMVAGLIYIDNYDEALESVDEVRRSLLTALIDRKISKFISSMNGIIKKIEKDKYFFTVKFCYIEKLKESRFSILEEVKTVNIGNEMSVTLSIGIGINSDNYAQNYDYARIAIDMALGRGGDQAVIKEPDKIQYFGGKAQQLEKNTRVKARVKAHALRELLETKDKVLIMGHKLSDIDALGAALGIYRIATSLNKKANIVINDISTSIRPMMDRINASQDYPSDVFLTGEKAAELVDNNTILVVVDVNRPSITDAPELLKLVKTIVVLDHHRQSSEIIEKAVLSYVEPYASSTCEMVAEILQYIADRIKIKPIEADAMYAGIVIDTNNFTNQTGVRTFEAAAFLRRNGADITRVRKQFRDNMDECRARAEAISSAVVYKDAFAIGECPCDGIANPTIVAAQAANELLGIKGIKASIVLSEYNNMIYVSARSIDEVNVQVMMEQLGGGGHRSIAGAQLKDISISGAIEKIKATIDEMQEKGDIL